MKKIYAISIAITLAATSVAWAAKTASYGADISIPDGSNVGYANRINIFDTNQYTQYTYTDPDGYATCISGWCTADLIIDQPYTGTVIYSVIAPSNWYCASTITSLNPFTSEVYWCGTHNLTWASVVMNGGYGVRVSGDNGGNTWGVGAFGFAGYAPASTSTPTATPTRATATPGYAAAACFTPTPTPRTVATRTPIGTVAPLPTGPTPTPTQGSYKSNIALFTHDLFPWTTGAYTSVSASSRTVYSDAAGYDGFPGVAALGDGGVSDSPPTSAGEMYPWGWLYGAMDSQDWIIYDLPSPLQYTGEIYISGKAKATSLLAGDYTPWIEAAYYDQDFDLRQGPLHIARTGTVLFVPDATANVGSGWSQFGIVLRPLTSYSTTLAFTTTHRISRIMLYWGGGERGRGSHVLIDDVRIFAGKDAVPVCDRNGLPNIPTGGLGPFPGTGGTQTCTYYRIPLIVTTGCVQPASGLDLWAWIKYASCSVSDYFTWTPENTTQITDIQDRHGQEEPVASIGELPSVMEVIWYTLSAALRYHQTPEDFWAARRIDLTQFMDFTSFDAPQKPDLSHPHVIDYSRCNDLFMQSATGNALQAACFGAEVVRDKYTLLALLQWVCDLGVVYAILKQISKLTSGL